MNNNTLHLQRIMRISILIYTVTLSFTQLLLASNSNGQALQKKVTISMAEQSLVSAVQHLKRELQVDFAYDVHSMDMENIRVKKMNIQGQTLAEVLQQLLANTGIGYSEAIPGTVTLFRVQQPGRIAGRITDAQGQPLAGANIRIVELNRSASTDDEGRFSMTIQPGSYTIIASYISYDPQRKSGIMVGEGQSLTVDFALAEALGELSEVVVVGYGKNVRKNLTTAVGSVTPDNVAQRNVGSANQLLQGQLAGVNLTVTNGTPGGKSRVSIRGISSINGDNEPLYVIDGIPLSKSTASYNFSGEYQQDPLSLINPNDIATIDVLKDAAATAIYGSRGTNGVVIITTKQGKQGTTQITVNQQTGIGVMPKKLNLLTPEEYIAMQREAVDTYNSDMGYAPGQTGYIDIDRVLGVVPSDPYDVNWQDMIIRDRALTSQTDLAFSGGTDKVSYFTSGGYQFQEGMIKKSALKRYSLRSNIDYKAKSYLNFGMRLNGNYTLSESIPNGNQGTALFQRSLEQRPYDRPFLPDGSYAVGGKDILRHNALIILDKDDTEDKNFQGLVNLYANINFLKWFTFQSSYNTEVRLGNGHRVQRIGHPYNGSRGWINDVRNYRYSGTFDNTLTFARSWVNGLDVEAMATHSFYQDAYTFNQATGTEFPSDDFKHITAATIKVGDEDASYYNMESYIGRLNLAYKNRYFLMASARYDGSSKFSKDNRYATFPAFSLGWVFSEERFMDGIDWLEFAKLRVSWGKTGNQDGIGNYSYLPLARGGYNYNALTGLSVTSIGNANLMWETSVQTNVGTDLTFLNGRLSLTYDYFVKKSDNLLYDVPVLATSGFNTRTSNIGAMENKGHELSITSRNIERDGLSWSTQFNIAFIRNRVTSLLGDAPITFGGWNAIIVGQPLGTIYGYKQLGIYQTLDEIPQPLRDQGVRPGDMKFADLDGNGIINSLDQTVIGNSQPKFSGGLTNTLQVKDFDFSLFTTFSFGNDVAAAWRTGLDHLGATDYGGLADSYYGRWTGPGTSNTVPRATKSSFNLKNSNYFVEDGSYLRIKSLTVGYRLPNRFVQQIGLSGLRVYATGVNLYTFTSYSGYDPEASATSDARDFGMDNLVTPQPRSYMLGLTINF
ncbi:TonB-dependent receptor [Parapedobacter sp. ISTM3]|uniref:SusC/RagA family TonB-linked outer membrane protein n=1 Tax=Parapedobacter sp. ISTM3 TaxID=2800130 RepID=UPI001905D159|nr:TonB-dependent receptor [Parapedobacter sp. ISTM3]MBK1438882.1 TonB-dependent receptor [Parapedobacter sp. ISTM3]